MTLEELHVPLAFVSFSQKYHPGCVLVLTHFPVIEQREKPLSFTPTKCCRLQLSSVHEALVSDITQPRRLFTISCNASVHLA